MIVLSLSAKFIDLVMVTALVAHAILTRAIAGVGAATFKCPLAFLKFGKPSRIRIG